MTTLFAVAEIDAAPVATTTEVTAGPPVMVRVSVAHRDISAPSPRSLPEAGGRPYPGQRPLMCGRSRGSAQGELMDLVVRDVEILAAQGA